MKGLSKNIISNIYKICNKVFGNSTMHEYNVCTTKYIFNVLKHDIITIKSMSSYLVQISFFNKISFSMLVKILFVYCSKHDVF